MNSKGCLTLLGLLIVVLLGISFFLPKDMNITVTKQLNASPEQIFAQVNDVTNWPNWSPWWGLDPDMKVAYGDITAGEGASYSWESDKRSVGNGAMIINKSVPNEVVGTTLKFEGMDDSYADMNYTGLESGGTEVAWDFKSDYNAKMPWSRYMMAFYKSMLGKSYNKGLDALDAYIAENPDAHLNAATSQSSGIQMSVKEIEGFNYVAVTRKGKISTDMHGSAGKELYAKAFGEAGGIIAEQGLEIVGQPLAFGIEWDEENDAFEIAIGMPVKSGGTVHEGGKIVQANFYGDYNRLNEAHEAIDGYMKENELTIRGNPWEVYVSDPGLEPDTSKWLTQVHYPIE